MTEQKIKEWEAKKYDIKEAEAWNNLPKGQKYNSAQYFNISKSHCSDIMLTRAGQQICGGTNYWESPHGLNIAVMKYIVANWDSIYPIILETLKQEEINALKDCQLYIDKMQKLISETKLK